MGWLDGIINSMDMSLSKCEIAKDREAWHAAVHGVAKRWTGLNYNNKTIHRLPISCEGVIAQWRTQTTCQSNQNQHEY